MELDEEDEGVDNIVLSAAIEEVIAQTMEPSDNYYAREGMDASAENGYFASIDQGDMFDESESDSIFSSLPLEHVETSFKSLCDSIAPTIPVVLDSLSSLDVASQAQPTVYLTDDSDQQNAIDRVITEFSLNIEQARVFQIIANHTFQRGKIQGQLLLGLFGEAGTGKSRVVKAVKAWFRRISRESELIVTATTGVAAFNIGGVTLHSALGIGIEEGEKSVKMSHKKLSQWVAPRYVIVDEISIMGASLMITFHKKLCNAKSTKEDITFGGVNIIFLGDFLQLPSVSSFHLYTNKPRFQLGYDLWRSLNAVIILRTPMRQIEDPRYAELLHRLRLRQPTQEDIDLIKSRIGAPVTNPDKVPILVRRNELRHKLNNKMVHLAATRLHTTVIYCLANIKSREKMSLRSAYALRYGHKRVKGDAILPLVSGVPLMITTNISIPLGNILRSSSC